MTLNLRGDIASLGGAGQKYTFTIDEGATGEDGRISVNYDGFINDVRLICIHLHEASDCDALAACAADGQL